MIWLPDLMKYTRSVSLGKYLALKPEIEQLSSESMERLDNFEFDCLSIKSKLIRQRTSFRRDDRSKRLCLSSADGQCDLLKDIYCSNKMNQERQDYEYQITLLNVKMKVKFPCRMKLEHQGSLLTGQAAPSDDHRYIFNQAVTLRDQSNKDCFEITVNLLTEKGAKYIAGIIKLYQAEMMRSEGEKITLSLSKCIDSEAFCEVKVDMVVAHRSNKNIPYDRKSALQRDVPFKNREPLDMDHSPHRSAYKARIQESKSEYQFPLNQQRNLKVAKQDWQTKSKSRYVPQTVYSRSKVGQRLNYPQYQQNTPIRFEVGGQTGSIGREKILQAEVYKEGYQKLKQKYKKEAEVSKNELNKRLALENSENNLKLQIMRLKLKAQQSQKSLVQKNSKLKQLQIQLSNLMQKQADNVYLRDEHLKKDNTIRVQEDKIRSLTRSLQEIRDLSEERSSNDANKLKEAQQQIGHLKNRLETRERQLQKQLRSRVEELHHKQLQLVSKTDHLDRQRKTIHDLEKALQNKHFEMEKLLQNERTNLRAKMDEQKIKIEQLERELLRTQQDKREFAKDVEQYKNTVVKMDYEKKLLNQELQSIKAQLSQAKTIKEKYAEVTRTNRSILEERSHLEKQLERTIQSKESNISQINKQFQDQLEYYKRANRELDQKVKALSNKLIEVEGQLDISRNQQDKVRRNLQSSIKEAADAKEKEKTSRKALKIKQQQMLSMETQQATLKQKLKSIDQIYKLQSDKNREEIDKIRIQLQNQMDRNEQLQQTCNSLNMQLNKVKIKLQYSEDKAQKDALNLREKQKQVQSLIKDYEEQIAGLDQTITSLRVTQKQLATKLQKSEMQLLKSEQKWERTRKDLKLSQERYSNIDSTLKTKLGQIQSLHSERQSLQHKYNDLQLSFNDLKNEHVIASNEKNKNIKINEILQEEIKKLKIQASGISDVLVQKEKVIEELRKELKEEKEANVMWDVKFGNFKKEVQRNKEALFDVIQKSLYTLPLGIKEDSRKNVDLLLKKPVENTFAEYFNLISGHSKEIKQSLIKQVDLIKQLEREKERLQEEVASSSNKYQNTQMTLKKQIEELELELQQVIEEKQIQLNNHSEAIEQMDLKIKQFEMVVQQLNNQIEELNFTNNSIKMDYEVLNQQNSKKISNLKKINSELQQKLQYQVMVVAELDERCSILENSVENLQTTLTSQGQAGLRKDRMIQELKDINDASEKAIEQLKRNKKQLIERVSELQLYLQTEKELCEKNKQLLAQQESKASELKTFISSMMKQKEVAIKSDLERSETIINLEASLHEVSKQLELVREENAKTSKSLESQKQLNKKMAASIKELQSEKKEEKAKYVKSQELLREKERQLLNKDETIKKLELKFQKTVDKMKAELKQIQEELDVKNNQTIEHTRDSNDRIFHLEAQVQKKTAAIEVLEAKITEMQEQLFAERQKSIKLEDSTAQLSAKNEQLKMKLHEMETNFNEINDQAKTKEEQLFDFSGKTYNLERKLESKQREHLQEMEYLNNEWSQKYDSMCQEYEQRLELVQKERDYFKALGDQKDKEISKLNQMIRSNQNTDVNMRKLYEDKLRKAEEDRLALLSAKNLEVQRTIEENKAQAELIKNKEGELRRITNQLEVARKTITNLDLKSREYDEKLKGVNKLYQTEMEQLKKRDVASKSYKQSITNYLWNTERQIKKGVQIFIKNFLDLSEDKNSQRIVELARTLEKSILDVLATKPSEK